MEYLQAVLYILLLVVVYMAALHVGSAQAKISKKAIKYKYERKVLDAREKLDDSVDFIFLLCKGITRYVLENERPDNDIDTVKRLKRELEITVNEANDFRLAIKSNTEKA